MGEPYIKQPAQIDISLNDLTRFWINGIEAFRTGMGLAVESGMSLDQFVEVAKTQMPFLKYIVGEISALRVARTEIPEVDALARDHLSDIFRNDIYGRIGTLASNYHAMMVAIRIGSRAWTYKLWEHTQQLMGFAPKLEAFAGWLATSELPSFPTAKLELNTTLEGRKTFEQDAGYRGLREGMEVFFSAVQPFQEGTFAFQFTKGALCCYFTPADGSKRQKMKIEFASPLVDYHALYPKALEAMGTADLLGGAVTMTDLMNSTAAFTGIEPFAGAAVVNTKRGKFLDVSQTQVFRAIEHANATVDKVGERLRSTAWR